MSSEGDVPPGSSCVLDTNVILYAHQRLSDSAMDLLRRCAAGDIIGVVPSTVWEELCRRLMVAEAVATGRVSGPNPVRKLAEQPQIVCALVSYRDRLAEFAAMGLRFEAVTREDFLAAAVKLQKDHGLLTNDSVIAACAQRVGVDYLITSDHGFSGLTNPTVVVLVDVKSAPAR